jgi:hypothetical protein
MESLNAFISKLKAKLKTFSLGSSAGSTTKIKAHEAPPFPNLFRSW